MNENKHRAQKRYPCPTLLEARQATSASTATALEIAFYVSAPHEETSRHQDNRLFFFSHATFSCRGSRRLHKCISMCKFVNDDMVCLASRSTIRIFITWLDTQAIYKKRKLTLLVGILQGEGGGGAILPRLGAKVVVEAGAGGHGLGVEVSGERAVLCVKKKKCAKVSPRSLLTLNNANSAR